MTGVQTCALPICVLLQPAFVGRTGGNHRPLYKGGAGAALSGGRGGYAGFVPEGRVEKKQEGEGICAAYRKTDLSNRLLSFIIR